MLYTALSKKRTARWGAAVPVERKGNLARMQVPFCVLSGGNRRARAMDGASMTRRNTPNAVRNPRITCSRQERHCRAPTTQEQWEYRNAFHRNGKMV